MKFDLYQDFTNESTSLMAAFHGESSVEGGCSAAGLPFRRDTYFALSINANDSLITNEFEVSDAHIYGSEANSTNLSLINKTIVVHEKDAFDEEGNAGTRICCAVIHAIEVTTVNGTDDGNSTEGGNSTSGGNTTIDANGT